MSSSLTCESHKKNKISHFCVSEECILPLCSECIVLHGKLHQDTNSFPELRTIEELRAYCMKKISNSISLFRKEKGNFEFILNPNSNISNPYLDNLRSKKEELHSLIEVAFHEFETQYNENIQNLRFHTEKINNFNFEICKSIDVLEKMDYSLLKLDSISSFKFVLVKNFIKELEGIRKKFKTFLMENSLKDYKASISDYINEEILALLNKSLGFNLISEKTIYDFKTSNSMNFSMEKSIFNINSSFKKLEKKENLNSSENSESKLKIDSLFYQHNAESDIFTEKEMKLKNKFVGFHFLQPNSDVLHILEFKGFHKFHFKTININMDITIPKWHRSVETENGDIFLTGGVSYDQTGKILDNVYYLHKPFLHDPKKPLNAKKKSPMLIKKCNHGIVAIGNFIYVLGGTGADGNYTQSFEKYNILLNKWTKLPDALDLCNSPSLVSLGNNEIVKIGGKKSSQCLSNSIEIFIISINKWQPINIANNSSLPTDFKFLSASGSISITEKIIIVFGGTYEDSSVQSNCVFFLERKDERQFWLKSLNEIVLPHCGAFSSNQAFLDGNRVFMLQDEVWENDSSKVYLDRKRVLKLENNTVEVIQ